MPNITISKSKMTITVNKTPIQLSKKAFDLLYCFANNKDKVMSRDEIISKVWDHEFVSHRTVDVHVTKIRNAIGMDAIDTVIGAGYKLVTDIKIDDKVGKLEVDETTGITMGPYKNAGGDVAHTVAVADSKYGPLMVFLIGARWHTMPIKEFQQVYSLL